MSYSDRLEQVKQELVAECRGRICDMWGYFNIWLSEDAPWEIPHKYERIVEKYFGTGVTPEIKTSLHAFGENLVHAIGAFISTNKNATLDKVLSFMENMVLNQFSEEWWYELDTTEEIQEESNPSE
jgi:hypothetical protein